MRQTEPICWILGSRDNSVQQSEALCNMRDAGRRVHQTLPLREDWLDLQECMSTAGCAAVSSPTPSLTVSRNRGFQLRPVRQIRGAIGKPKVVTTYCGSGSDRRPCSSKMSECTVVDEIEVHPWIHIIMEGRKAPGVPLFEHAKTCYRASP